MYNTVKYIPCLFLIACGANAPQTESSAPLVDSIKHSARSSAIAVASEQNSTAEEYLSTYDFKNTGEVVFDVTNEENMLTAYLVIDGQYVNFAMLDRLDQTNSKNNYQGFAYEGDNHAGLSSGVYDFEGQYKVISAVNPMISGYGEAIKLQVDFDTGLIYGGSKSDEDTVIQGHIYDEDIEFIIKDPMGFHRAEGFFFGEKAEELVAAYQETEQSGIIYAEQK